MMYHPAAALALLVLAPLIVVLIIGVVLLTLAASTLGMAGCWGFARWQSRYLPRHRRAR